MSALAACLLSAGFTVAGSDLCRNERTAELEARGVAFVCGHAPERAARSDAVVYSSAVPESDPELAAARAAGIPVYDRAELLALIASCFEISVGIAGCHGKTTATAMCAHVLQACGGCTAHIGGEDLDYGSYFEGGNRCFVTEVCEYRGNIRKLRPTVAVVLNTDADHLECYGSAEALFDAYAAYARSAPAAVVCGDDPICSAVRPALTFGFSEKCDVRALRLRSSGGRYSFTLNIHGEPCGRIRLYVYGKHNVYNALAAADAQADSAAFVEFMLEIIRDSLTDITVIGCSTVQDSDQVSGQDNSPAAQLLSVLGEDTLSAVELMRRLGLSHRPTFRKNYLNPALERGLIQRTVPDKPNSKNQKYRKCR